MNAPTKKELSERIERLENILDQMYDDFFAVTEKGLPEKEVIQLQRSVCWEAIQEYDAIRPNFR